jgi:3-oxoacyl-[acyl-carrier protein] reductase
VDLGLTGKVALVTAANKGLGKASAAALAAEGANVVIASRNREMLEQTARAIRQASSSTVLAVPTDLRRPEAINALVEKTVHELGGIDILVTNTGAPPAGTFETLSDEQWQAMFELILLSAIRLIRAVLPSMQHRQGAELFTLSVPQSNSRLRDFSSPMPCVLAWSGWRRRSLSSWLLIRLP